MKYNRLYYLLQEIRKNPLLYLGDNDVRLLHAFIDGYNIASNNKERGFLDGFNAFCEERFDDNRSLNWAGLIAEHTTKENGISTFFSFLDEFLIGGTMDEIMAMLDEDNSPEIQKQGVECARTKPVCLFLMPTGGYFFWKNCALVVNERKDLEIKRYLEQLLIWAEDNSKPGSDTIYNRLRQFRWDKESLLVLRHHITIARTETRKNRLSELLYLGESGTEQFIS